MSYRSMIYIALRITAQILLTWMAVKFAKNMASFTMLATDLEAYVFLVGMITGVIVTVMVGRTSQLIWTGAAGDLRKAIR